MVNIDNYYKFVFSTFGLAYFTGLIVALIFVYTGSIFPQPASFINSLHLTSNIYFKNIFVDIIKNAFQLTIIPFSYLVTAVTYGFSHTILLTSSFLGQIKLLVQFIPQIFYFISFIIFSTIGLKLILFIIKKIVNYVLLKQEKNTIIKIKVFNEDDILLFFIGLLSITIGTIIQVNLTKILFIFLINFRAVTLILIILFYIIILITFIVTLTKLVRSVLDLDKQKQKGLGY